MRDSQEKRLAGGRRDRAAGLVLVVAMFPLPLSAAEPAGSAALSPPAVRAALPGMAPLTGPPRFAPSFIEAPPFDEDAQAMARLRLSRDPAIVEMVRLIDERERRLALLRSGRAEAPQSGDPLAFQREVQDAKLDCQRGMLVAQLDRARSTRRDAPTVARLERTLDAFDRNRATLRARVAGRGER